MRASASTAPESHPRRPLVLSISYCVGLFLLLPVALFSTSFLFGTEAVLAVTAATLSSQAAAVWHIHRSWPLDWPAWGLRPVSWPRAVAAVLLSFAALAVVLAPVFTWLSTLWPAIFAQPSGDYPFGNAGWGLIGNVLLLAVATAVLEELFFRGLLFAQFRKKMPLVGAVVLTSLLFGILHLYPVAMLYTFVLSIVACLLTWRFNSIVPAVALHILNNSFALVLQSLSS